MTKVLDDGGSGFAGPIPITVTCVGIAGSPWQGSLSGSGLDVHGAGDLVQTGTQCSVDEANSNTVTPPTGYR